MLAENILKLIDAFYLAKKVNHYYWMHTDGDDPIDGSVSIENILKIISLMSEKTISKKEIEYTGKFTRAFVDRYAERAEVYIIDNQDENWKRVAAVKEYCHILLDGDDDFEANPRNTIRHIKEGTGFLDEHSSAVLDSEKLAEMIAIELVYPLELREPDRIELQDETNECTVNTLVDRRKVPARYIEIGTSENHIQGCREVWKRLPVVEPPNLNHLDDV